MSLNNGKIIIIEKNIRNKELDIIEK